MRLPLKEPRTYWLVGKLHIHEQGPWLLSIYHGIFGSEILIWYDSKANSHYIFWGSFVLFFFLKCLNIWFGIHLFFRLWWSAWHCRYADPLVYGDYPDVMKKIAGSRLPAFTNLESNQVKDSFDFLGLNYYFGLYIKDNSSQLSMEVRDFFADMAIEVSGMFFYI